jgi:hypothetical protein
MQETSFNPSDFPSLDLCYDQSKDVLDKQSQLSDSLDNKATALWVLTTAIIGFVVPMGLSTFNIQANVSGTLLYILIAAGGWYLAVTILATLAIIPHRIGGIVDPDLLWDHFATLPKERFMVDMVSHVATLYKENEGKLNRKAWLIVGLFIATGIEVAILGAWVWLVFA